MADSHLCASHRCCDCKRMFKPCVSTPNPAVRWSTGIWMGSNAGMSLNWVGCVKTEGSFEIQDTFFLHHLSFVCIYSSETYISLLQNIHLYLPHMPQSFNAPLSEQPKVLLSKTYATVWKDKKDFSVTMSYALSSSSLFPMHSFWRMVWTLRCTHTWRFTGLDIYLCIIGGGMCS